MTQDSTLRPYVQIGIALLLAVTILNGLLMLLDKTPAMRWLPARLTGGGFVEDIQQRIAGATQAYRNGSVTGDKYLCVLVGISDLREAADLKVLLAEAGHSWRFLGGAGAGPGVSTIQHFADMFINSSLRPDLVIIGLNPVQLLDTILPGRIERVAAAAENQNTTAYSTAVGFFKRSIWVHERRKDISLAVQDLLHMVKTRVLQQFGVSIAAVDPRSPWREMIKIMGTDRFPMRVLQNGLITEDLAGAFERDTYVSSTESRAILYKIARSFRNRGAKVMIVLMPGQSLLESREPPGIDTYIEEKLKQDLDDPEIIVRDYRGKVPDDGFVDLVHMNPIGSAAFSRLLGKDVGALSMSQPPLMSPRARLN
jgi:hypothetical protein